jgi:hypothetical protein
MCTLTWRPAADAPGYDLFFNRDERNLRGAEHAPETGRTGGGVEYIAPMDADHGGTWLVLNAHGVTVCLLNYYPRGVVETGTQSRGKLPLFCAGCARAGDIIKELRAVELKPFAPFHLIAVDADGGSAWLKWDGHALHEAEAPEFLTSSSFEPPVMQARREAAYAAGSAWGEAFHWTHNAQDGAGSVLMRRPDAATRSVCRVRVRADKAALTYAPVQWTADGAPQSGEQVMLALLRA